VPNEIAGGAQLKIVGEVELAGNGQNHVAEFGQPQGGGHLVGSAPLSSPMIEDYSVELWAKPSHYHRGVLVAMSVEHGDPNIVAPEKHGFMMEFLRSYENHHGHPGSVRFLHRSPPGVNAGTSCYSDRLYTLRRWQHIVAIKGKSSMRLYIDGALVAKERDSTPLPDNLRLVVGQTFQNQSVFPFVGQLDELAVYARALNEKEIRAHCELIQGQRRNGPEI
jgi:hypothetical protein